ncbi:MAG: Ig-like domain-containing protein [Candidatus Aenigmatarchaeota archaeon]
MNKRCLAGGLNIFSLLIASSLIFLLSFSVLTFAAPEENPCGLDSLKFCLVDAFGTEGNESVVVCAGMSEEVNWFNVWYNGTALNTTNGGIISSQYYDYSVGTANGTDYNNELLSNSSDPSCVLLVLNGTDAPFTNQTMQINATVGNKTDYATASAECGLSGCNGTMFTINYVSLQAYDASGSAGLPNTAFMAFDNSTKSFLLEGPALSDTDGYWAEHCMGVVAAGECVNLTPLVEPNWCLYHGISFPSNDIAPICAINQTTTIIALDFISSNKSKQNVTPGTPLLLNLDTPASMAMVMVSVWSPESFQQQNIPSQINVHDNTTDELLFIVTGQEETMPAFLEPYRHYKIKFNYGGRNYSFPFMTPVSGMTGAQIFLANSTIYTDSDYRTVVGKVVNQTSDPSGNKYPVPNATVYAQFFKGPSGAFGIQFFNSSVTDENGMFSMRVPRSLSPSENSQGDMYFPQYQFFIVSDKTNNGVPIYFPTIDNNNNRGYFAIGDTVVLPPLTLKAGGLVEANLTLNSARMIISELSKFSSTGTGIQRDAVTGKFSMTSMFDNVNPPSSMNMSFLSPIGNELVINFFGKNMTMGDPMTGSIIRTCFNTSANVTQGSITSIKCNLTEPGYLNLTVYTCNDIFDYNISDESKCSNLQNTMNRNKAGSFDFWFETSGILRNSNGQIVSLINPEGVLLENLVGFGSQSPTLSMPLPAGNYTLELTSSFDFSQYLNVYNKTNISITPGETVVMNLVRADNWNIQPMFNPSMALSDNNNINVSIMTKQGTMLNGTNVVLTAKILFLNKTVANATTITFSYDSSRNTFYNLTFRPASFNLDAGKYKILLNASNFSGNTLYTATNIMQFNAYDFQVGMDLGGFTFGTNQTVNGKIFVFNTSTNPPTGINSSSIGANKNVTVKMYDSIGTEVSATYSASNITDGQGYMNLTMPTALGFYQIVTSVTADNCFSEGCTNGTVGVSDNWVQISNVNIKTTTDRQSYQTSDNVVLTIQVSNSTTGAAIEGASVEVVADSSNTPAIGTTGSNGKATITLNSSTHSGSTSWSYGWHNLKIKISKNIGSNIVKLETWFGFDVRGTDLFVRPERPSYQTSDNVTILMYGPIESFTIPPSGVKVDGTTLSQGPCNPTPNVTFCINDAWSSGSKEVKIGNWSVGHHNVEITSSTGGGQQKFYVGFDVNSFNIMTSTDKFSYDLNENITLSIKATTISGTAISGQNLTATLYKAQSPNDILVAGANATTNSTGHAIVTLNATKPGFNYIMVNMEGQKQFIGVQVSTLKATLLSGEPGPGVSIVDNYDVLPGGTVTIYVNATRGGAVVPDGTVVTAKLWSFGNYIEIPSNTTTNGNATISLGIPAFSPLQKYGLEVRLTSPDGEQGFAPQATVTVTGGAALRLSSLSDRSFNSHYKTGDTATLTAKLTYMNGTGVSGYNVTFEVGSDGTTPRVVGTSTTGSDGTARKIIAITGNYTDGPYFLHVYLTNSSDVHSYSGFFVSSLRVEASTNSNTYSPGDNVVLNITVYNRTSGSRINATSGFLFIFNKEKGEIQQYVDTSGQVQPYQVNISIPNEANAIGTYPIAVNMFVNQSQGFGFVMVDVKNASQSLNMTMPNSIDAGTYFLVNISSSLNGTATMRTFSPTASSLMYENTSISLSTGSLPNATINMSITDPGVYVFNVFVSGIGMTTQVVTVLPPTSGTIPALWTGSALTTNATTFDATDNVYILCNIPNAIASVLTLDENTTITMQVPLSLTTGSNYYSILNSTVLVSGRKYFVRLDTNTSTGVYNTMFTVN